MAYIKVASPYEKYLESLRKEIKKNTHNAIKINDKGAARYLGRIGKLSDAFTVASNRKGESFLILTGKLKKLEKGKNGTFYESWE